MLAPRESESVKGILLSDVLMSQEISLCYTHCYTSAVKFKTLQENLRKLLWARIEDGALTGLHLAALTGFKQAHISNFLNRKCGLSFEGMDKVLGVQRLSVLDLLDHSEIDRRASIMPCDDEFENVAICDCLVGRVCRVGLET